MLLSELSAKVLRLLGDAGGVQFDATLIADGVNAALDGILPWFPKAATLVLLGDGSKYEFDLAADHYRTISVYDEASGFFMPQSMMAPAYNPNQARVQNDWAEYPKGKLSFSAPIALDLSVTVFYGAHWSKPVLATDALETPDWLGTALSFFSASYCLLPKATQSANVRQYNVQVDSGSPIMNPMHDMSEYFYARFKTEMDLIPAQRKAIK